MTSEKRPTFTPGPWTAMRNINPEAGEEWVRDICADDGDALPSIIEGAYFVCSTDEENEANARLIAAAPEMYEALRRLEKFTTEFLEEVPVGTNNIDALRLARAALAKAEGR